MIHLVSGNYADAAISAAGMIPYVGDAAKAAKYAAKGAKAVGKIGMKVGGKAAAKAVDVAVTAGKKLASVGDNVMKGGEVLDKVDDIAARGYDAVRSQVSKITNIGCFVGGTPVVVFEDQPEVLARVDAAHTAIEDEEQDWARLLVGRCGAAGFIAMARRNGKQSR